MTLVLPAEAYELERLVNELNRYAVRFLGETVCENPFKYLKDMQLIDTDAIRHVGIEVWGQTGQPSRSATELEDYSDKLRERLLTSVQDRWEGSAYTSFDQYMRNIEKALDDEAARMPVVGEALVAVADAFEVSWLEIVAWVLTVVGMLVAVIGFILSAVGFALSLLADMTGIGAIIGVIVGAASLVLALISLILAAASAIVTYLSSVQPRLDALSEATTAIDQVRDGQSAIGRQPSMPTNPDDWQPKTDDPYS